MKTLNMYVNNHIHLEHINVKISISCACLEVLKAH